MKDKEVKLFLDDMRLYKNNYIVPKYYCHSLNPVNAVNILEILNKATK